MKRDSAKLLRGLTSMQTEHFSRRDLVLCAFLIAIYFVAGRLGLKLAFVHESVTAIWLPSGIALAAFVLLGYRVWPAILIGAFLVDATSSGQILTSIGIAVGNTLEGLAGAYFLNRYARGAKAFNTAEGVFKFVFLGCIANTLMSATVGVGVLYLAGLAAWPDLGYLWLTWWLADGIGVLLVAPFLILLFGTPHHPLDWRETLELVGLILGLILVALLVFSPLSLTLNQRDFVQVWLCVPFLIWGAFRFCQLEAAGITLILFGSAIWGTLHGFGPFVNPDMNVALLHLDTFIGVICTMTMAVAAMVAERRRTEEGLIGFQSIMHEAVEEKARDLAATIETLQEEVLNRLRTESALRESNERFKQVAENIHDVFWLMDVVEERVLYVSPAYETIWGRTCNSLYVDAHSWIDAVIAEDQERALIFFERANQTSKFEAEYRVQRPDGSVRWIWDRGFVIPDASGRTCRIAGLASDITERKQLEKELERAQIRRGETE
ncbi:MAG: MASE1 domain-containing protein [Candidatus Acidiferrales bacterium]